MSDVDQAKIEDAVEIVCQSGCGKVREIINEIKKGIWPQAALDLNQEERALFLEEIVSVMHAYQDKCKAY